jgi:hypothetical protein
MLYIVTRLFRKLNYHISDYEQLYIRLYVAV